MPNYLVYPVQSNIWWMLLSHFLSLIDLMEEKWVSCVRGLLRTFGVIWWLTANGSRSAEPKGFSTSCSSLFQSLKLSQHIDGLDNSGDSGYVLGHESNPSEASRTCQTQVGGDNCQEKCFFHLLDWLVGRDAMLKGISLTLVSNFIRKRKMVLQFEFY